MSTESQESKRPKGERIEFSPKARFQRLLTDPVPHRMLMTDAHLHNCILNALAEMAWRGCSSEQISGARTFIYIMLNLGESDQQMPSLPAKTLAQQ